MSPIKKFNQGIESSTKTRFKLGAWSFILSGIFIFICLGAVIILPLPESVDQSLITFSTVVFSAGIGLNGASYMASNGYRPSSKKEETWEEPSS